MNNTQLNYLNAMGIQTWRLKNIDMACEVAAAPLHESLRASDLMIVCDESELKDRAGHLLNSMLSSIGYTRDAVCIANLDSSLEREIETVQPKVLLGLGKKAADYLLNSHDALDQVRGKIHTYKNIPLVITYHPVDLLRNPADKRKVFQDLLLAVNAHTFLYG